MEWKIVQAGQEDLPRLEELYARSRAFMAAQGNPYQWGQAYPQRQLLEGDIQRGHLWMCLRGEALAAAFVFAPGPDPSYLQVDGEGWPDEGEYGVVHRLAAGGEGRGAGAWCLRWCLARCRQVRIDTHRDNHPMQSLLAKLGFVYCGTIRGMDGAERLAYWRDGVQGP